jgi:hypothetical protein
MDGGIVRPAAATANAEGTLAMCNVQFGLSGQAEKLSLMSEWKEQADAGASFGAWAASQLLENTECDVTANEEVVSSNIRGKWIHLCRATCVDDR